ncbi:hypothetical protein THRCLA_04681 [Thraustotheca clavata]|uniref:N-acetylglucosaminylphosphatidylinositol deacetylase n=1 Tax=Thraustotheca clavata TaxID=74557 RepID=A0A1V9ZYG1_9STRA|nr:hypothetical protein THRCLA_04681 [Thraustotheca clavata]
MASDAIKKANDAVQMLLLSHMGIGERFDYRSLFASSDFASLKSKQTLLTFACITRSSPVIMDVLLFLSHTMSEMLFYAELCLPKHAIALDHWANHLRQQRVNEAMIFVSLRDYPLIALYKSVERYHDMATEVTRMILAQTDMARAMQWVEEATQMFNDCDQTTTGWLQTQLGHYIDFTQLLQATEARDKMVAPAAQSKSGYCDKHSAKGAKGLNWHKRYFVLEANKFCYYKYDQEKMQTSTNPFLDKKARGDLQLTQAISIRKTIHHSSTQAKQLDRPYCLEILSHNEPVILFDPWTEADQLEWFKAFQANLRRTHFDPIWLRFPRPTVTNMTMAQFLRYAMLYPDGNKSSHEEYVWDSTRIHHLQTTFNIDPNRILYTSIVHCGLLQEWDTLEALARPGKVKRLFTSQPQSTIGTSTMGAGKSTSHGLCAYGYIKEGPEGPCSRTYASLSTKEYNVFRLMCGLFGLVMLVFSLAKLWTIRRLGNKYESVRHRLSSSSGSHHHSAGSGIQKVTYWLLVVSSLTFIIRSVDPWGYMGIFSYVAANMIVDTCTACIYSILILAVSLWARVVVQPKNLVHLEYPIRAFQVLGFVFTWVIFFGILPISVLFMSSDVYHSVHILIQFSMAPFLLVIIATMGLIFGIQIHCRLREIRRTQEETLEIARRRLAARQALIDLTKPPVVKSESQDDTILPLDLDTKEGIDSVAKLPSKSSRILKMVCFLEAVSIVVIGLQIYQLVDFINNGCIMKKEFDCASGKPCHMQLEFPYFHAAQMLGIIVIFWAFRKTRQESSSQTMLSPDSILMDIDNGNYDGLGAIRTKELSSCWNTLGMNTSNLVVIDDDRFQDGMKSIWKDSDVANATLDYVTKHSIDTLFTFDDYGISGHPNHIAVHHGIKHTLQTSPLPLQAWCLESVPIWRKYVESHGHKSLGDGALGLALLCSGHSYRLMCYNVARDELLSAPLDDVHIKFTIQQDNYVNFYVGSTKNYSMRFKDDSAVDGFLHAIAAIKAHLCLREKMFLIEDSRIGEGYAVNNGDIVGIAIEAWETADLNANPNGLLHSTPILQATASDLQKLRLGDASTECIPGISQGLVGMQKGGKRYIYLPQELSDGTGAIVLAIVELLKVKKEKKNVNHEAVVSTPIVQEENKHDNLVHRMAHLSRVGSQGASIFPPFSSTAASQLPNLSRSSLTETVDEAPRIQTPIVLTMPAPETPAPTKLTTVQTSTTSVVVQAPASAPSPAPVAKELESLMKEKENLLKEQEALARMRQEWEESSRQQPSVTIPAATAAPVNPPRQVTPDPIPRPTPQSMYPALSMHAPPSSAFFEPSPFMPSFTSTPSYPPARNFTPTTATYASTPPYSPPFAPTPAVVSSSELDATVQRVARTTLSMEGMLLDLQAKMDRLLSQRTQSSFTPSYTRRSTDNYSSSSLLKNVEKILSQNEEYQNEIAGLQQELQDLRRRTNQLQDELDRATSDNQRYLSQSSNQARVSSELNTLQATLDHTKQRCAQLEADAARYASGLDDEHKQRLQAEEASLTLQRALAQAKSDLQVAQSTQVNESKVEEARQIAIASQKKWMEERSSLLAQIDALEQEKVAALDEQKDASNQELERVLAQINEERENHARDAAEAMAHLEELVEAGEVSQKKKAELENQLQQVTEALEQTRSQVALHHSSTKELFKGMMNDIYFACQDAFDEDSEFTGKEVAITIRKILKQQTVDVLQKLENTD